MAGTRAATVFAGEPQPVEIHHRGIWYSGELLGWRHDEEGRLVGRVRCVVDGLRHSTWKDFGELRLPDPGRPPRREPFPAPAARPLDASVHQDPDDATRPHVLLADLRTRPRAPAHALTPPPPAPRDAGGRQPGDWAPRAAAAPSRRSVDRDRAWWRDSELTIV